MRPSEEGFIRKGTFAFTQRSLAAVGAAILALATSKVALGESVGGRDHEAATPIKHVVIVIGETRSFDQVFATYKPVNGGETVFNLLSQGIVKDDGNPGPNYDKARQYPVAGADPYVPLNQPAIGDLMDMFDFRK